MISVGVPRTRKVVLRYLGLYVFFQAEDGIRDGHVTGVQTCALPILAVASRWAGCRPAADRPRSGRDRRWWCRSARRETSGGRRQRPARRLRTGSNSREQRSEERRVGKDWISTCVS